MYQLNTSAFSATADGVALAYRAGVPLMDMEMVQYHPTTLKGTGMVVTEGARGQGAYLVNNNGDRFMSAYSPETLEMTSRDLTARAVATEIAEGRGTDGCVFLDFQHIAEERLDDLLPETQLLVKRLGGVNLQKELVPVRPAMHRPIGGIQTDVNGATALSGLYAAGESACVGVHGANRLGGNSLLESAVFGRRAGESAAAHAKSASSAKASDALLKDQETRIKEMASRNVGEDTIGSVRRELAKSMHEQVGMYRDAQGLSAAMDKVKDLKSRYQRVGIPSADGTYNPSLASLLELENMLDVAQVIVASAQAREESRGAHYRNDFPNRDDANWSRHTVAAKGAEGTDAPSLDYKPVVITQWSP
jgi:succinate dehydrogenase / fumarate reductase flavoprotein subunit